jgi:hypothetical protein
MEESNIVPRILNSELDEDELAASAHEKMHIAWASEPV